MSYHHQDSNHGSSMIKKKHFNIFQTRLYFRAPNLLSAHQYQSDLRLPDRELESAGSGQGALACSFANLCMSALSTKFNRISLVNLRYYRFGQAVMTLLREGAVLCSDAARRQACIASMVFEILVRSAGGMALSADN